MEKLQKTVRRLERALFVAGAALMAVFVLAHAHRLIMVRAELASFEQLKAETVKETGPNIAGPPAREEEINEDAKLQAHAEQKDDGFWSIQHLRTYTLGLTRHVAPPLAVLRIPKLRLEVPVLEGTEKLTLNRGVGHITGTALPGQRGNVGIAGHRDGFFSGLREINRGDTIELLTATRTDIYVVDQIAITTPDNVSTLQAGPKPSLTLVTCYPFNFIGTAPKRYIISASLSQR